MRGQSAVTHENAAQNPAIALVTDGVVSEVDVFEHDDGHHDPEPCVEQNPQQIRQGTVFRVRSGEIRPHR